MTTKYWQNYLKNRNNCKMSLREEGREGWREGGEGGEGAMMLGRERVSVDEWRVDEDNERGRDGTRDGRREGKREG